MAEDLNQHRERLLKLLQRAAVLCDAVSSDPRLMPDGNDAADELSNDIDDAIDGLFGPFGESE